MDEGPRSPREFVIREVEDVYGDYYEGNPDGLIQDAIDTWEGIEGNKIPREIDALLDQLTTIAKEIAQWVRFAETSSDDSNKENGGSGAIPLQRKSKARVPQGETVEENITLGMLRDRVKPWIIEYRERIHGETSAPFDTVAGAVRFIQEILELEKYRLEDVRIGGDIEISRDELKKNMTEDDEHNLERFAEKKQEGIEDQLQQYEEQYINSDSPPENFQFQTSLYDRIKRIDHEAERIADLLGFTTFGLMLAVLTPYEPTKPRFEVIKHEKRGFNQNAGGSYVDQWVTINLYSADVTGDEIRKKIIKPARKQLNAFGDKHLSEKQYKVWRLYQEMDRDQFKTGGEFWEAFRERYGEKYDVAEDELDTADTYRINFNRLMDRIEKHEPGLMNWIEDTT